MEDVRGLKAGDILVSSWGFEQTNVDFYEVVSMVGKASVSIRKIAGEIAKYDSSMSGTIRPVPGEFIGGPFTKRAKDGRINISSYSGANKVTINDDGNFRAYYWSSYA